MTRIRSIVLAFCVASGVVAPAGATIAPVSEISYFERDPVGVIQERLALFRGAEAFACLNPDLRESFAGAIDPENIGNLRARVSADNLPEFEKRIVRLHSAYLLIDALPNCSAVPSL